MAKQQIFLNIIIIFSLIVLGVAFFFKELRYDLNLSRNELFNGFDKREAKLPTFKATTEKRIMKVFRNETVISEAEANKEKVKAAFVVLTRNSDLKDLCETLSQLEMRFNRHYHYPYVFLNDKPFTDKFKNKISKVVSGNCKFGLIPEEHWSYPSFINQERAVDARRGMAKRNIIYGFSESYRHMCRYESGFFFRHPLMMEYDWYWRVEPGVQFPCDIDYDPFLFMQTNNKKYAFTISLKEFVHTIPTLWNTTKRFMKEHADLIPKRNMMNFVTDKNGGYNLCHFWSNFEIGSLKFFRSKEYLGYFDYLDKAGGFFYERWGDAPVHSLAVAMFLRKDEVQWFRDIGYYHPGQYNCPKGEEHLRKRCWCNQTNSVETLYPDWSCTLFWESLPNT